MLTDFFIKRPILSLVISVMIVLLGVQAFFDTQVRQYPELESSVITVTTAYPGASAELIQGFISTPIQQVVSSTAGIDYVRSIPRPSAVKAPVAITCPMNFPPYRPHQSTCIASAPSAKSA